MANYSKDQKTLIRDADKVAQTIDFAGFVNGKISPSDIDITLEFNDKYLILFEIKEKGKRIPMGQKLLLERIARAWGNWKGKTAVVIFCTHTETDFTKPIPLANVDVEELYVQVGTEIDNGQDSWGWIRWTKSLKDTLNSMGKKWNISDKLHFD